MYCSGNPVILIDPNGLDEWEINKQGEVVGDPSKNERLKTTEHDAFYIVDENGNRTGESISFKYGTVEGHRSELTEYTKDIKDKTGNIIGEEKIITNADIFKVRGDDNGKQLFEFFADNTDVEWSHAMTGIAGDKGLNFITTGHDKVVEPGMTALINGQLQHGYTIRELNHSHPLGYPNPSPSDMKFANQVSDFYNIKYPERINNITFKIYTGNGHYNTYYPK